MCKIGFENSYMRVIRQIDNYKSWQFCKLQLCTNYNGTPCTRHVIWLNCLFVSTYLCVILSPPLTVVWSPSKTYPHLKSMYVSSCYPPISLISSKDLKILLNCIWEYSTKYILGHFEEQWKLLFSTAFSSAYSVSFFMNFIHS